MRHRPLNDVARSGLSILFALTIAGPVLADDVPIRLLKQIGFLDSDSLTHMMPMPPRQQPFGQVPALNSNDDVHYAVPHLPAQMPKPGQNGGWRVGEQEIRVRSRGNAPLNFAIMVGQMKCSDQRIDPGTEVVFMPCGETLAWNDGERVQAITINRGTSYEMAWGDGHWIVYPLNR